MKQEQSPAQRAKDAASRVTPAPAFGPIIPAEPPEAEAKGMERKGADASNATPQGFVVLRMRPDGSYEVVSGNPGFPAERPRVARKARLGFRATDEQKDEIESVAEELGIPVTQYLWRAHRAYRRRLQRKQQYALQLTEQDQRALVAALLAPPAPVPALAAAMERYQAAIHRQHADSDG